MSETSEPEAPASVPAVPRGVQFRGAEVREKAWGPKGGGEHARKELTEKAHAAAPISGSFRSSESCLQGEEVRNTYSLAPWKLNAWNVTSSNIQVAQLGGQCLLQCPGQQKSPGWAAHSTGRRQCTTRLACSDPRGQEQLPLGTLPSQHPQRWGPGSGTAKQLSQSHDHK